MAISRAQWQKTNVSCLLRNKHSGRYYGRFKVSGKQKWVALGTDVFTVAKLRLTGHATNFQKMRGTLTEVAAGEATMGQLIEVYREQSKANVDLRPGSIVSRITAIKKLLKTWPGIEDLEPSRITPGAVQAWATKFKHEGTHFTAPGTKTVRKGNSASSVNRAIDVLRGILNLAIERGQIHFNPATVKPSTGRLKKKITPKKLILPAREEVDRLIAQMWQSGQHGGWGIEASYLCRFLKMSGARIGEVPRVTWRQVLWPKQQLHLPGYKSESSDRYLPLFPALEALLYEIIEFRKRVACARDDKKSFLGLDDSVFRIRECQKTIDAAAKVAKVPRITHHDFRHLFATAVIESGVDIPTLSRWLGHSDGGLLAMKTYGHLRQEHSQASAQKVMF